MIALKNVTFSWAQRPVLKGISLEILAGQFCVLLGRNGAGKSTALRLMAGELTPESGEVLWEGRALANFSLKQLAKRRGVLPQQSSLGFPFTVLEVAQLGRFAHAGEEPSHAREIVKACLKQAGLDESFFERSYLELSTGERQRVHLARALAQVTGNEKPSALLLDEPVASLDLAHQHAVLETARAFAHAGNAVFAILHDLNLALQYADRVLLLHEGTVLADGAPREVLTAQNIVSVFGVQAKIHDGWIATAPL